MRAKCKRCNKEMQGLVARMRQHHEKCGDEDDQRNTSEQAGSSGEFMDSGNYPPPRSPSSCSTVSELSIQDSASLAAASSSDTHSHIPPSPKRKKKPLPPGTTIDRFVIRTSRLEKELIDEKIAQFIYATNSSFRLTENPHFINMVQSLRPGYSPPSRADVAGKLLDQVYDREMEQCATALEGKIVKLSIGWSNVHNDPIVCACITTEEASCKLASCKPESSALKLPYYRIRHTSVLVCFSNAAEAKLLLLAASKTRAFHRLNDDVPPEVKKRRLEELITVFREEAEKVSQKAVRSTQLVLVEGHSKRSSSELCGRNDGNTKVVFPDIPITSNSLLESNVRARPGDYVLVERKLIKTHSHAILWDSAVAVPMLRIFPLRNRIARVHIPLELGYVHTVRIWLRIRSSVPSGLQYHVNLRKTKSAVPMVKEGLAPWCCPEGLTGKRITKLGERLSLNGNSETDSYVRVNLK
ncbi:unnamed protein product, partial [Ranitomeya imitator]